MAGLEALGAHHEARQPPEASTHTVEKGSTLDIMNGTRQREHEGWTLYELDDLREEHHLYASLLQKVLETTRCCET